GEHNDQLDAILAEHLAPPVTHVTGSEDEHQLSGGRILDMTTMWAGPAGTYELSRLGAEVIYVTWPETKSVLVKPTPRPSGLTNPFGYFRGKTAVQINIKTPEGLQLVRDIAAKSDALIQNFAAGVIGKLGM